MKVFFDTEFTGLHQDTTLVSVGCWVESGVNFYAEFTDYNESRVDEWIETHVLKNLHLNPGLTLPNLGNEEMIRVRGSTDMIKAELVKWLAHFQKVEMWGDCLAYDWVLFCQIFGGAFNIPKNVYYIPFDISTLLNLKGVDPDINREEFAFGVKRAAELNEHLVSEEQFEKHNALWDASVIKRCYDKLNALPARNVITQNKDMPVTLQILR